MRHKLCHLTQLKVTKYIQSKQGGFSVEISWLKVLVFAEVNQRSTDWHVF